MPFKRMFRKQQAAVVQIHGNVPWEAFYDPRTKVWIAVCKPLNLNATGETWAELQACANEAMQLLFEDLLETGELNAFLRARGWSSDSLPPSVTPRFDVPSAWQRRNRYEELAQAHA